MLFACDNEKCRVHVFSNQWAPLNQRPNCWTVGRSIQEATIDDLLAVLDKRVHPEQLEIEKC